MTEKLRMMFRLPFPNSCHYTSKYVHALENEIKKKLLSQYMYMYIKGLFLHGNLHSGTTLKLFWFYLICHFCSFDKAIISLNHRELNKNLNVKY